MCLIWVIPMRDLLPLLKRHPQLYHKACSQLVPKVLMDYLTISPLVGFPNLTWTPRRPGARCVSVTVL